MQKKRLYTYIGAAVALILILVYGFMPRSVPVEVAEVSRGPLKVTIVEEGITRVRERYTMSAPSAGYLQRVLLKAGDAVKKGDTLATLEPLKPRALDARSRAEAEARLKSAEAALKSATEKASAIETSFNKAASDFERMKKLHKEDLASESDFENAESLYKRLMAEKKSATYEVDAVKGELEAAKAVLYTKANNGKAATELKLRAPSDGRVLKIFLESEGPVTEAQPIIEIGDTSSLEVSTDVLSEESVKIKPGMPVIFDHWGGVPLVGKVRVVEPGGFTKISALGVEEQRVNIISDITSPAETWQSLGDGYRVETSFVTWEGKNILQLPSSAIFRHENEEAVFVYEKGKARLRAVKTGHTNGLFAEALSGINEGERVIRHPSDKVFDGAPVKQR
ncbi:MAG: efflux RND transporter periplasmic adaptor subunit [Deltaproteobacteria bacterium]|nr:efflux RND transporter periplasmic adaptor subunit [Deltaproteobacteria bacterium]